MNKFFISLFAVLFISSVAFGQRDRSFRRIPGDTVQWALARVFYSERGSQVGDDDSAIAEVLRNRSQRGRITLGIIRAYSPLTMNRTRTDNRRWIAWLPKPPFRRPRYFPGRWRGRSRKAWIESYERAGMALRGELPSRCLTRVDHWGNHTLDRRSRNRGWMRVPCGRTLNHFWFVPRRRTPRYRRFFPNDL